jgi:large subunit ribosomal protein L11
MSANKPIASTIKLLINAGQAKPSPPVGPALGQAGLKIMDFCKDFNAKTAHIKDEVPIPVVLTAYQDKTFTWRMKTPPSSYFIKQAAGIDKGSKTPGHQFAGTISLKHLYEIAKVKIQDMDESQNLKGVVKSLVSTCHSMGIKVVARPEDADESSPLKES